MVPLIGSLAASTATTIFLLLLSLLLLASFSPEHLHHAQAEPRYFEQGKDLVPHGRTHNGQKADLITPADLVVVTTLDGSLHGVDKATGEVLWSTQDDSWGPLVRVTDIEPASFSSAILARKRDTDEGALNDDDDEEESTIPPQPTYNPFSQGIYIPEPTGNGDLYYYEPGKPIRKLPLPIKKIVDDNHAFIFDDYVFTGKKVNRLSALDALTGDVIRSYGGEGDHSSDASSILAEADMAANPNIIYIGRTQYILNMYDRKSSQLRWNITYGEYSVPSMPATSLNDEVIMQAGRFATEGVGSQRVISPLRPSIQFTPSPDGAVTLSDSSAQNGGIAHDMSTIKMRFDTPAVGAFQIRHSASSNEDAPTFSLTKTSPSLPVSPSIKALRNTEAYIGHINGTFYILSAKNFPEVGGTSPALIAGPTLPASDTLEGSAKLCSSSDGRALADCLVGSHPVLENETPVERSATEPAGSVILLGLFGVLSLLSLWAYKVWKNGQEQWKVLNQISDTGSLTQTSSGTRGVSEDADAMQINEPGAVNTEALNHDTPASGEDSSGRLLAATILTDGFTSQYENDHLSVVDSALRASNNDNAPSSQQSPSKAKKRRKPKSTKQTSTSASTATSSTSAAETTSGSTSSGPTLEPALSNPDTEVDTSADASSSTPLRHLTLTSTILGYGSHGTVVYLGTFQSRRVAIKRLLLDFHTLASHEVRILQESDDHPNVVRYFYQECHKGFMYIALELCMGTLADLVERREARDLEDVEKWEGVRRGVDWKNVCWQVMNGVAHLHGLKIVHRDIKPQVHQHGYLLPPPGNANAPFPYQNILIAAPRSAKQKQPRILISDFGLGKRLADDQSSFHNTHLTAGGTSGWRAPECIRAHHHFQTLVNNTDAQDENTASFTPTSSAAPDPSTIHLTPALDIFSTGLVCYYALTSGSHPFNPTYTREHNILRNTYRLTDTSPHLTSNAKDLIKRSIHHQYHKRPTSVECLSHPFFWSNSKTAQFLSSVSDLCESLPKDPITNTCTHAFVKSLERGAHKLFASNWTAKVHPDLLQALNKYRKYDPTSIMHLLRAIRNVVHHWRDLDPGVRKTIGEGVVEYFEQRVPGLVVWVWSVVKEMVDGKSEVRALKEFFAIDGMHGYGR
ncbi:hypothetical protein BC832DRAFT_554950 [Gaertneriomyces semiglobifer]|nr:hypothetical protein BC832DRAFT_554950 [Gaertneriomyces semiglobifer]